MDTVQSFPWRLWCGDMEQAPPLLLHSCIGTYVLFVANECNFTVGLLFVHHQLVFSILNSDID